MARILRGEIWWAELDPVVGHEQAGNRPVIVISHDILNAKSGVVIALAITSRQPRAGFPISHRITSTSLPKPSWVLINQVRTLSVDRLRGRIEKVSDDELDEVLDGLAELIR